MKQIIYKRREIWFKDGFRDLVTEEISVNYILRGSGSSAGCLSIH